MEPESPSHSAPATNQAEGQRKKTKILVVEDEAIVAADIGDRLSALNYEIVGTADNCEDAVRKASELKPDLVLMDIMLNGDIPGTEAADQIREQLHLPVVYLTANSNDTTFMRARDTGPFGFVLKPFEESALRAAIEIAIYKHRAEREREKLIQELQEALAQIKTLRGMLPICCNCKKVRDDSGYWNQIESYIEKNTDASFSHGYCPECAIKYLESNGLPVSQKLRDATAQKHEN